MGILERNVVQVSVEDTIRILENVPVEGHIAPHIVIAQVMNRLAIAHLSIEKALKVLTQEAGGNIKFNHHLGNRFGDLKVHDSDAATFLEEAFRAAVEHYGINANEKRMTHFRALKRYLETTGGKKKFECIRYWELKPSLEEMLLRQVHLYVHMELLYGLHEILIATDRPKETVTSRVERAIETAMRPSMGFSHRRGKATELSENSYFEWLNEYGTLNEALADAVQRDFVLDNDFATEITKAAYKTLLEAKDPAVRHFASTLDVLPKQSGHVIPDFELQDDNNRQWGRVSTPSGETLGFIEKGPHGFWYITPIQVGPIGVAAKAKTQRDAICYLGQLLTKSARVTVEGVASSLRIVGQDRNIYKDARELPRAPHQNTANDEEKTYRVDFWDKDHGLEAGREVLIESIKSETEDLTLTDKLSGEVVDVNGHQVYVEGRNVTAIGIP